MTPAGGYFESGATRPSAKCILAQRETSPHVDSRDCGLGHSAECLATAATGARHRVYPVASQQVLWDLVAESGPTYQRTVKATLRSSYTNHFRSAPKLTTPPVVRGSAASDTDHSVLGEGARSSSRSRARITAGRITPMNGPVALQ